jgi:hypothetical protein
MLHFYKPDLTADPNSPFVRDAADKLIRRGYWLDMTYQTLVLVMTQGIGANLTNDEKRAHLRSCTPDRPGVSSGDFASRKVGDQTNRALCSQIPSLLDGQSLGTLKV